MEFDYGETETARDFAGGLSGFQDLNTRIGLGAFVRIFYGGLACHDLCHHFCATIAICKVPQNLFTLCAGNVAIQISGYFLVSQKPGFAIHKS